MWKESTLNRLALAPVAILAGLGLAPALAQDKVVKIYNWSDYIDPQVLKDFTAKTGIQVVYDLFDSNEVLETKLLAGSTGYDLVVPTGFFLGRQIQAGIFQPLDKGKIPNWRNLDPELMGRVAKYDPGNQYAPIYLWGTTGLGYNVDKVKERLPDAPTDSWALLFDPENAKKLADCGIMALDAPTEVFASALRYLGEDPDSKDPAVLDKAGALLERVRPYIRKFHNSEDINALANGDICLALMWSGDAGIARTRAEEAKNGVNIRYVVPKEGALQWSDMLAMPADAPNPDNAYAFLDYLLQPEVMAKISNFVTYPNAVPASYPLIDEAVKADPNLFPTPEMRANLFTITPFEQKAQRTLTRMWTKLVTGS
ncbi:MAG: polyamine ABC transporter substrate-binding protein [Geminicoccaceae bacterium]